MKTVRLYGELGKRFGRTHRLAVKTPAEAVRALIANHSGFESHLMKSEERNVVYKVSVDKEIIDESSLRNPFSREIHIAPMIRGAGSAGAKFIIGAVLVVAGIIITGASFGGAAAIGGYMINAGIGFMIAGAAQALVPVPKIGDPTERPENKPSYVFNGPVNTTAQGQPVAIGYGRLIVGGAVISAGIETEQMLPLYEDLVFVK